MSALSLSKIDSTEDLTSPEWLQLVRSKVENLRYGVVQIVVHDSQVTQIERTEKTRFDSAKAELARQYRSVA